MKKIYLFCLLCAFVHLLKSEDLTQFSPKLQDKFQLHEGMTISQVTDSLGIPHQIFLQYFSIDVNEEQLKRATIRSENLSIDQIYQYYNQYHYNFDDFTALNEASKTLHIPYKKLAEYLGLNPQKEELRIQSIRSIGKETADIIEFYENFQKNTLEYCSTLSVLAVIITTIALILIVLIIYQMGNFGKIKVTKYTENEAPVVGKVQLEANDCLNSDVIVAIAITLERFRIEKLKEKKLIQSIRRANTTVWQMAGKIRMPNSNFSLLKKQ